MATVIPRADLLAALSRCNGMNVILTIAAGGTTAEVTGVIAFGDPPKITRTNRRGQPFVEVIPLDSVVELEPAAQPTAAAARSASPLDDAAAALLAQGREAESVAQQQRETLLHEHRKAEEQRRTLLETQRAAESKAEAERRSIFEAQKQQQQMMSQLMQQVAALAGQHATPVAQPTAAAAAAAAAPQQGGAQPGGSGAILPGQVAFAQTPMAWIDFKAEVVRAMLFERYVLPLEIASYQHELATSLVAICMSWHSTVLTDATIPTIAVTLLERNLIFATRGSAAAKMFAEKMRNDAAAPMFRTALDEAQKAQTADERRRASAARGHSARPQSYAPPQQARGPPAATTSSSPRRYDNYVAPAEWAKMSPTQREALRAARH